MLDSAAGEDINSENVSMLLSSRKISLKQVSLINKNVLLLPQQWIFQFNPKDRAFLEF